MLVQQKKLHDDNEIARAAFSQLEPSVDRLAAEFARLQLTAQHACAEIAGMRVLQREKQEELVRLLAECDAHKKTQRSLQNTHKTLEKSIRHAQKALELLKVQKDELQALCGEQQSASAMVGENIAAMNNEYARQVLACAHNVEVLAVAQSEVCDVEEILCQRQTKLSALIQSEDDERKTMDSLTEMHKVQTAEHIQTILQQQTDIANGVCSIEKLTLEQTELAQSIQVLLSALHDYTDKLDKIQQHGCAVNSVCDIARTAALALASCSGQSASSCNATIDLDDMILKIIQLLENFTSWFEITFNAKLYDFMAILLNSRLDT
jgi:chromosome segregation ATPase